MIRVPCFLQVSEILLPYKWVFLCLKETTIQVLSEAIHDFTALHEADLALVMCAECLLLYIVREIIQDCLLSLS